MGVRSRFSSGVTSLRKVFGNREPAAMQQGEIAAQMTPASPFSPGEPIGPYDGFNRNPRTHDFVTGYNISARPRSHERVSFETLRGLVESYDVAQMAIWHRIDSIRSLDWSLVAAEGYGEDVTDAIPIGLAALKKPDRDTPFATWLGQWLYDTLAFDAGTLYRMRNRAGNAVGLRVVDGTCYSDDTEVLTRSGWKRFADVDITCDEFATRNQKTKAFEWQAATHYTVRDWAGREPLYRFHSRSYDLLVTGNHRMLVTSLPKALGGNMHRKGEVFVSAEDLAMHASERTAIPATSVWTGTRLTSFRLPPVKRGECVTMSGVREARVARGWSQAVAETAADLTHQTYWSAEKGRQVELGTAEAIRRVLGNSVTWEITGSLAKIDAISGDDYCAFMGMWLSEGSLNGDTNYVYVSQQPGSKGYQEFRDLLTRILGAEPSYNGKVWRFKSAALAQYLRQFGHAPDKYVPAEILDASSEQLAIFWRFYMLGDGNYEKANGRQRIVTTSKRMADGLQEVAQKIGYQASIVERPPSSAGSIVSSTGQRIRGGRMVYVVALRTSPEYLVRNVERVPYAGKVYCVTVPNETLYVRRKGKPSWCGNTVAPLLDYWGNTPQDPSEAYVQYVNGLPWNWLTRSDLIYAPFRKRANTPYGLAPIETILLNANTDLRFQAYFLQRFTEGNVPAAFATAPETWTPQQVEDFQRSWDAFMLGDQAVKSQIKWLPGGSSFAWTAEKDFSDHFSLFLMRKTAAAYHVVPADLGFTENVNRSSGESQADVQHRVGDLPLIKHIDGVLTSFLQEDLHLPLRFAFDLGEEQADRRDQAEADKVYVEMGAISPSDVREMRYGLPEPDGQPVPRFIYTSRAGPIPLASLKAVSGKVDPATAAPVPGTELPHTVFGGAEGVAPVPPIKDIPLAEQIYGPDAMPPGPPPQPVAQFDVNGKLVKNEGAPAPVTEGITTETGIHSYDLVGNHRTEDEDDEQQRAELVKRELAAFRSFRSRRRKAGQWRDFEFRTVDDATARRLNSEGRASVAKAAGYSLNPRSGMVSLDLPEGLITPVPGGVTDHHITVVYLGPDVDDDAFADACDRAEAAAAECGPLHGSVGGIGVFPPSDSSDGKTPAWAAVTLPGAQQLRDALADLSASEHLDWHPHVTLAYLDEGEPLPAPLPRIPVTFTHLSVHRGNEVRRFPLGAPVVKAGGGGPKGGGGDSVKEGWPAWHVDERLSAAYSERIRQALGGVLDKATARRIAASWLNAPAQGQPARVWLEQAEPQLAEQIQAALHTALSSLWTAAWAVGTTSAFAVMQGKKRVDWSKYASGVKKASNSSGGNLSPIVDPSLMVYDQQSLQDWLDHYGIDSISSIASTRMDDLASLLETALEEGASPDSLVADIEALGASADIADMIASTEVARATSQAALASYEVAGVGQVSWLTAPGACQRCQDNESASPIRLGDNFPSGSDSPPSHPRCRCSCVPSSVGGVDLPSIADLKDILGGF